MRISLRSSCPLAGNTMVLVLIVGAVIAVGIILTLRSRNPVPVTESPAGAAVQSASLTPATLKVLKALEAPIEVRLFSMLGHPEVSQELRDFSERIEKHLSLYVEAAGGRLTLVRVQDMTPENQQTARAEGLRPFPSQTREAPYLGIVLVQGVRKAVLPQLLPEWEQAFEPDLTRAIENLARASDIPLPENLKQAQQLAKEQVKQTIPNLESVSLEEAKNLLKESSMQEYRKAAADMQAALQEAEAQVLKASTAAETETAVVNLKALRAQHTEKLQEIARRMQAQIQALEQLKR